MNEKRKLKKDDPEQSQRFVETARKLEVDESGKSFERSVRDIARRKSESNKN